jgi:hypothetical protein
MSGTTIPAFPTVDANRHEDYGTIGMTLRDYFAAKAMAATIANPDGYSMHENIVKFAYEIADAMLKARQS